jgi:hypothetical protein
VVIIAVSVVYDDFALLCYGRFDWSTVVVVVGLSAMLMLYDL